MMPCTSTLGTEKFPELKKEHWWSPPKNAWNVSVWPAGYPGQWLEALSRSCWTASGKHWWHRWGRRHRQEPSNGWDCFCDDILKRLFNCSDHSFSHFQVITLPWFSDIAQSFPGFQLFWSFLLGLGFWGVILVCYKTIGIRSTKIQCTQLYWHHTGPWLVWAWSRMQAGWARWDCQEGHGLVPDPVVAIFLGKRMINQHISGHLVFNDTRILSAGERELCLCVTTHLILHRQGRRWVWISRSQLASTVAKSGSGLGLPDWLSLR